MLCSRCCLVFLGLVPLLFAGCCPSNTATTEAPDGLIVAEVTTPAEPPTPTALHDWGEVDLGMTEEQVRALVGEPESTETKDNKKRLEYPETVLDGIEATTTYAFSSEGPLVGLVVLMPEETRTIEAFDRLLPRFKGMYGPPDIQGLAWNNDPGTPKKRYTMSLSECFDKRSVTLVALWDQGEKLYTFGVAGDAMAFGVYGGDYIEKIRGMVEVLSPLEDMLLVQESFTLGNFQYVIESVVPASSVGSGYSRKKASEGATFIVVKYTIENTGNETATALTGDLNLLDGQDRKFLPSTEGTTALVMSEDYDLMLTQLQPGIKKKQAAVFEVPDSVLGNLRLVVPEKGLLSSNTRTFTLSLQ